MLKDSHDLSANPLRLQLLRHYLLRLETDLLKLLEMSIYISYLTYYAYSKHDIESFVHDGFDPGDIDFNTFPTMVKHIVDAMLPNDQGEIHENSLHEGA